MSCEACKPVKGGAIVTINADGKCEACGRTLLNYAPGMAIEARIYEVDDRSWRPGVRQPGAEPAP